jgi:translin
MDLGVDEIEKRLMEKEKKLDRLVIKNREIVRLCSNAIKAIHAYDLNEAKKLLKEAEKQITEINEYAKDFPAQTNHVMQEFIEAKVVLHAIEKKTILSYRELGMPPEEAYLNGLLDAVGELKREMYESLRRGNKHEAEIYFKMMEEIYDQLLPLRFSTALLPEFRRKQDVARIQIEQARGELL